MRTFLLTIFWISNIGNAFQFLVMTIAAWLILSGTYSFVELNVDVFLSQIVPWLAWIKTIIIEVFGDLGRWILLFPILVISPLKFIAGLLIGWWAYVTAKNLPVVSAYP